VSDTLITSAVTPKQDIIGNGHLFRGRCYVCPQPITARMGVAVVGLIDTICCIDDVEID